jgi:hypothetical protein
MIPPEVRRHPFPHRLCERASQFLIGIDIGLVSQRPLEQASADCANVHLEVLRQVAAVRSGGGEALRSGRSPPGRARHDVPEK